MSILTDTNTTETTMPPETQCAAHSGFAAKQTEHDRRLREQGTMIQKLFDTLDAKVESLNALARRPGWGVTTAITLLSSALAVSITIIGMQWRTIDRMDSELRQRPPMAQHQSERHADALAWWWLGEPPG